MSRQNQNEPLLFAAIAAAGMLLLYVIVYQMEPFGEYWDTFFVDGLIALAAALAAIAATFLRSMFERGEAPRSVWTHFAIALWIWTLAEGIWMVLDLYFGDFIFSIADVLWLLGYIFFAIAVGVQYRILYRWSTKKELIFVIGGLALICVISALSSLFISRRLDVITFTLHFYPIADFVLVLVVLWLVRTFHGGALASPWVGLFILIISDALYLWAMTTDFYWIPGGMPRLIVDTTYVFAYLVFALGCYSQYLLYRTNRDSHQEAAA